MRHLTGLDALRGVAALMVFVHHVQLPGLHPATLGMDAGVLIFFSLSGYLLYAPLVRAREADVQTDLRGYAIRRAARILPAYAVAAFVIAAIWYPSLLTDPIGIVLGTATPIVVVWTLQIEVEFYVALPAIAWLIGRLAARRRVAGLVGLAGTSIAATVAIMVIAVATTGFVASSLIATVATYLWAFVPGMIVAELQQEGHLDRPVASGVPVLGLILIGTSVALDLPPYFDLAAAAGSALLIAWLVSRPQFEGKSARVSLALGALSYPVYLWHEQIIDLVDRPSTWAGAFLALAITAAIASVSYLLIERPAMRLGHRFALIQWRPSRPVQEPPRDLGPVRGVPVRRP
jgi:peptidoglycan/LPS O-acetylase OafA/YrhL